MVAWAKNNWHKPCIIHICNIRKYLCLLINGQWCDIREVGPTTLFKFTADDVYGVYSYTLQCFSSVVLLFCMSVPYEWVCLHYQNGYM